MKRLSNNLWQLSLALPCMMLAMGCEQEAESNEPVELQIAPVVAVTRSAIEGGIQNNNKMQNVAVYATGTDYTAQKGNNYAIYAQSSGTWTNSNAEKIYLTNEAATIYAYYPTDTKYNTDLKIPVSILEGTEATTITAVDNAGQSSTAIASADGEVDCMWATSVGNVTNKSNQSGNGVELSMNHALSMVSFRVCKGDTYKGSGVLTKIVMKDATDPGTTLDKGTNPMMEITTGNITPGAAQDATYTRTILSGYTLPTSADDAKKFSILVLPTTASIGDNNIEATFKIDNADYSVKLTAPKDNNGKWLAGKNNLYTINLSGTGLTIQKVEVAVWQEVTGGTLEIK